MHRLKNVRMAALPRTQSGVLSEDSPGRSLVRRLSDVSCELHAGRTVVQQHSA